MMLAEDMSRGLGWKMYSCYRVKQLGCETG